MGEFTDATLEWGHINYDYCNNTAINLIEIIDYRPVFLISEWKGKNYKFKMIMIIIIRISVLLKLLITKYEFNQYSKSFRSLLASDGESCNTSTY